MKNALASLLRSKAWGIGRSRSAAEETSHRKVQVYRHSPDRGRVLVGELECDQGEYVFRYVPGYSGFPISAFPDKDKDYRSGVLWPFFEIRIPPTSREDVRKVMEERNLSDDDTMRLLAELGRFSIANPYELAMSDERGS